jgi:hypothetical protein
LIEWDIHSILTPLALKKYTDMLYENGPMHTVFSFLNCVVHQTCCPSVSQRLVYTGYKKFQAVVVLSGMIVHFGGPYHAPQNNARVLGESKILEHLCNHAIQPRSQEGDPAEQRFFQLYGDLAYGVSAHIVSPHVCVCAS